MAKKEVAAQCLIPVRPILLVGTNLEGKANFFEVGGGGSLSTDPPMIALSIRRERYTLKGILENKAFSVNIPSVEQARESDYCGIISGAKTDKVKDCNFKIFYGKLETVPMIEQCPINLECTLLHVLDSNSHSIVIGQIQGTYVSEEFTRGDQLDFANLSPLLWIPARSDYVAVGRTLGKTRSLGKEL